MVFKICLLGTGSSQVFKMYFKTASVKTLTGDAIAKDISAGLLMVLTFFYFVPVVAEIVIN
jgi:hypothetical protein